MAYADLLAALSAKRAALAETRAELIAAQERLKEIDYIIRSTEENGGTPDPGLVTERTDMQTTDIPALVTQLGTDITDEADAFDDVFTFHTEVTDAPEVMPDNVPVLLFPVRIETAFDTDAVELCVRIFPDDIAIETHEPALTPSEITSGKDYWGVALDSTKKAAAWDVLCTNFGAPRAAWIVKALTPTNLGDDPETPEELIFPDPATKFDSWTQQPHTRILPDAFVVTAYHYASSTTLEATGSRINYSVKVGIDPEKGENSDPSVDGGTDIVVEDSLKWMYDFAEAEAAGLGVRIPLTDGQMNNGFDRVVVLGTKFSLSQDESQELVEQLFDNHHYTTGFNLLEQGAATSNTNTVLTTYTKHEPGNVTSFAAETNAELFTPSADTMQRSDGQILADALGINYAVLQHVNNSDKFGVRNAIALNNALWEATGGYYLRDMLYPAVDATTRGDVRSFFSNHVLGGGNIPGIQIGKQPYGILVNSVISDMEWPDSHAAKETMELIQTVTGDMASTWNTLAQNANYAAKSGVDPQQVLTDMAARRAVSHEYYQRTGVGASYVWNNLIFNGQATEAADWMTSHQTAAETVADDTGLETDPTPRILQTSFLQQHSRVALPLVPRYASPSDAIGTFPSSSMNFMEWLRTATCTQIQTHKFSTLTGSKRIEPPSSFLYSLARQAVLLEYFYAGAALRGLTAEQVRESEFINVVPPETDVEPGDPGSSPITMNTYAGTSRWKTLNDKHPGSGLSTANYIDGGFAAGNPAIESLTQVRSQLELLEQVPASQLEALTAQHIDTLSFRLDSWRLGLASERLQAIRDVQEVDAEISRNQGVFIGAYGWVEGVRQREAPAVVDPPTTPPTELNELNQGFIHAPSLNHAAAAAVLRSGYIARAEDEEGRESTLAVNLSSERVREAVDLINELQNGSDLATVLGYVFERSLHERHPEAPGLDQYILPIRRKFPLRTQIVPRSGSDPDAVAARNTLHGLKLLEDYREFLLDGDAETYLSHADGLELTVSNPDEIAALIAELDRLNNIADALGDLSIAEGVFQTVQGNVSKANAMTNAVASGKNIHVPDVIKTPRTGTQLTNRITLNFEPLVMESEEDENPEIASWDLGSSPVSISPRSQAEPSFNYWLKSIIGDPDLIRCKVSVADTIPYDVDVKLKEFDLQPIDILDIFPDQLVNDTSDLCRWIRRIVRRDGDGLLDTVPLVITFDEVAEPAAGVRTFSEIHPLLRQVKRVLGNSRHLTTTDIISPAMTGGVTNEYDLEEAYDRYSNARTTMLNDRLSLAFATSALPGFEDAVLSDFTALRLELDKMISYSMPGCIFESLIDISEAAYNALYAAGADTGEKLAERLHDLSELGISAPGLDEDHDQYIAKIDAAMKIIFGNQFRFIPHYKLDPDHATSLEAQYPGGGTLLDDHSTNPLITEEWLQGVARVRQKTADYEMLSILATSWNISLIDLCTLQPAQFPYGADERWMAVKVDDEENIRQNRLSLGMCLPESYDADANQSGLLIDEWVEIIPNRTETSGVAFHYEQPESKPPQCIILAVSPVSDGLDFWTWENLLEIVNGTLDEAKRRAVDYEDVATTSYGHLLPAVVVPFTPSNTTIGFTTNEML